MLVCRLAGIIRNKDLGALRTTGLDGTAPLAYISIINKLEMLERNVKYKLRAK